MQPRAYYSENDKYKAAWLRNLIAAGEIAPGEVDERDIRDILPSDLDGFTQCHFFAGIGAWSHALRRAGIPDTLPVWTGSCPCFPAGTLILTDSGQKPVEDVEVGDRVLTHRGRWMPVTATGSDYSNTVTVKGQGHWGLRCTPDHPFYARERSRSHKRASADYGKTILSAPAWTAAKSLEGMSWATVSAMPVVASMPAFPPPTWQGRPANTPTHGWSTPLARLLGFFVGNGWANDSGFAICDEIGSGERLLEIVGDAGLTGSVSAERTADRVRVGSRIFGKWLLQNFGHGASNKRVPGWLFGAPLQFRSAFLSGWAEAEGHLEANAAKAWTTTSRDLAVSLRILLNCAGRPASISHKKGRGIHRIGGRTVNCKGFYRVTSSQESASFKFDDLHGWGAVRSVTPSGLAERVYNLSVQEDQTYVADGIVVHNCQPFSAAGRGDGFIDERHLWPAWFHLIEVCRPRLVLAEQVASNDGLGWLDLVSNDLEGSDYAVGANDLCAAGFGAPHIRQRLFLGAYDTRLALSGVGDGIGAGLEGFAGHGLDPARWPQPYRPVAPAGELDRVADRIGELRHRGRELGRAGRLERADGGGADRVADGARGGRREERADSGRIAAGDCPEGIAAGLVAGGSSDRLANGHDAGQPTGPGIGQGDDRDQARDDLGRRCAVDAAPGGRIGGLVESASLGCERRQESATGLFDDRDDAGRAQSICGTLGVYEDGLQGAADPHGERLEGAEPIGPQTRGGRRSANASSPYRPRRPGPVNGFWRDADWLLCADPDAPRWRPVEPCSFEVADGTAPDLGSLRASEIEVHVMLGELVAPFPLAHGEPARVGRTHAYGDAIVAEVATGFAIAFFTAVRALVWPDDIDAFLGF